jgi:hypothetical protein
VESQGRIEKESTWVVLEPDRSEEATSLPGQNPLVLRIEDNHQMQLLHGASSSQEAVDIVNSNHAGQHQTLNPKKRLARSWNTKKEILDSLKHLQSKGEEKLVKSFPAFCIGTLTGKNLVRCIGYVEPGEWDRVAYAIVFQASFSAFTRRQSSWISACFGWLC